MKTILVLTDFSKNALIAAEEAVLLAGKLNANLLLCYTDYGIPVSTFYPGIFQGGGDHSWRDHCEMEMNKIKNHLSRLFSLIDTDQRKPIVSSMISQGDLTDYVVDLLKNGNIEMIAMGAAMGNQTNPILSGTEVSSMIEALGCRVSVFPENGSVSILDRILFAKNHNQADVFAAEYLVELGKLFEDQLEVENEFLF
jgi:nucleotide-binding universal stress UspA family protein